jgi:hypothetical protein
LAGTSFIPTCIFRPRKDGRAESGGSQKMRCTPKAASPLTGSGSHACGVSKPESPALAAPASQRRGPVQWLVSRPHCSEPDGSRVCIIGRLRLRELQGPLRGKVCWRQIGAVGNCEISRGIAAPWIGEVQIERPPLSQAV